MATTLHTTAHDAMITSPWNGWQSAATETWTWASTDVPSYTFTVPTDLTTKYHPGTKIKLIQSTQKFFIVTKSSYSAPSTTVTLYSNGYALMDAAMSDQYYSYARAPMNFDLNPVNWTEMVESALSGTGSPSAGVWYNHGSSLNVPIGLWIVSYECNPYGWTVDYGSQYVIYTTLSTANNTESDTNWTVQQVWRTTNTNTTQDQRHSTGIYKEAIMNLTTKDTFYLNVSSSVAINEVGFTGPGTPTKIKAVCAYL